MTSEPLALLVPDLIGVFAFSIAGGMAAVQHRLDLFGVIVLAAVTSLGGGTIRDVLIGSTPPRSLDYWPYAAIALGAGALAFWWHPQVGRISPFITKLDALGLGVFTATGATAALRAGLGLVGACAIGVLTGVGGGALRDILLRRIPVVLTDELYAVIALGGALVICALNAFWQVDIGQELAVAAAVMLIRLLAVRYRWSMPVPRL